MNKIQFMRGANVGKTVAFDASTLYFDEATRFRSNPIPDDGVAYNKQMAFYAMLDVQWTAYAETQFLIVEAKRRAAVGRPYGNPRMKIMAVNVRLAVQHWGA